METETIVNAGEMEFVDLFDRYRPRLLQLCLRFMKDPAEAEDACQETFLKALKAWDSFEGRSHPATWLTSICLNECRTRLRILKARVRKLSAYRLEMDRIPLGPYEDLFGLKAVFERGKARLNPSMRRIVSLHVEDGLNHREIAEMLQVSRVYITRSLGRINRGENLFRGSVRADA